MERREAAKFTTFIDAGNEAEMRVPAIVVIVVVVVTLSSRDCDDSWKP